MTPGRIDPCPCGSGKKYKHCCLLSGSAPVADLTHHAWQRMHEALEDYVAPLLGFTIAAYGRDAFHEAWFEFTLGESEAFTEGHPETELFFPWFFHRWAPAAAKGNTLVDDTLQGIPPTRTYLARKGRQLNPLLQRYLEACLAAPFGFYEILECEKDVGFTARDVFAAKEVRVLDRTSSTLLVKGDILYGQIVQLQGFAMLEATAPFAFPPAFKTNLLQVKHREELRSMPDVALRGIYRSLAEIYRNPKPPKILNTDGDVMEPRTLHLDIDSPWAAFDALKSLALGMSEEELRVDAKLDDQGRVVEVMVPWIRKTDPKRTAMETVLMGRLRIAGRKLTVEVNSAERARAARSLVTETLGASARYRRTRKQPLESMLPSPMTLAPGTEPQLIPRNAEQKELMQLPEIRAQMEAFQRRHYESWPELPLPALKGRTPLEAVKDPLGREMVDALITQFERDSQQRDTATPADVFAGLRRRLGL